MKEQSFVYTHIHNIYQNIETEYIKFKPYLVKFVFYFLALARFMVLMIRIIIAVWVIVIRISLIQICAITQRKLIWSIMYTSSFTRFTFTIIEPTIFVHFCTYFDHTNALFRTIKNITTEYNSTQYIVSFGTWRTGSWGQNIWN